MRETELANQLERTIGEVIRGQQETIRKVLACMFAGGHVLLEDFPGTGKTTLAKALAKAICGAEFKRVQFTPDLLPSRNSVSTKARFSPTSFSRTKSTAPRLGPKALC